MHTWKTLIRSAKLPGMAENNSTAQDSNAGQGRLVRKRGLQWSPVFKQELISLSCLICTTNDKGRAKTKYF